MLKRHGVCAVLLAAHEGQLLAGRPQDRLRDAGAAEAPSERRLGDGDELYPEDLILSRPYEEDPHRWLVVFHVIGIGYMLLGLNTVCDVYFTGALEEMVTEWSIKPDVAGATFMAAGGSAPEFFTSLIGSTIAMSDVGSSTIVGSAVFNVLFVIGLCGYVAKEAIDLTWWPLFRDCTFYIFGLTMLAGFAWDRSIAVWEAAILFCAYLVYLLIMYFNSQLEELVGVTSEAKVAPASVVVQPGDAPAPKVQPVGAPRPAEGDDALEIRDVTSEDLFAKGGPRLEEAVSGCTTVSTNDPTEQTGRSPRATPPRAGAEQAGTDANVRGDAEEEPPVAEHDTGDEDDENDFMQMPDGGVERAMWCLCLPIYAPLWYLTPTPASETWTLPIPKFVLCFLVSLCWIACFAFLLVWWVDILGRICHVPEIIMGFTILAAGTSIPDAVSSMAVARVGEGDMAVSSSIGSNIFDILVGLPVPWMIKTGIIEGGSYEIQIISPYLVFYIIMLLSMVFATIVSIHVLGWKLNKALAVVMIALYCLFLSIAMIVEFTTPEFLEL